MRLSQIRLFLTEMATLLRGGVPMRRSLEMLAGGSPSRLSRLASGVLDHLGSGESFADALRRDGSLDVPEYVAVIEAGERSGKLPELLQRLGDEIDKRVEVRNRILSKLAYPVLLIVLAPVLVSLRVLWSEGTLAYLAEVAMWLGPLVLIGAAVVTLSLNPDLLRRTLAPVENVIAAVPGLGTALVRFSLGKSLSLLGLLLESGLGLNEAFELTADASAWRRHAAAFREASRAVSGGANFTESMMHVSDLPSSQRLTIATGEESGTFDRALQNCGRELIDSAWRRLEILLVVVLPVVILLIAGFIVLQYALSVFTGI